MNILFSLELNVNLFVQINIDQGLHSSKRQNPCLFNLVELFLAQDKNKKHVWLFSFIVVERTRLTWWFVRRNCATLGHGGRGLPGVHYWARWSPCSPSAGLDLVLTSSACVLLLSLYRDRAGHCSCTDRPQQPRHDLRERKLCLQHHRHCPPEW